MNWFDKVKTIRLVCKTPITNPYLVEVFQPKISFVKEVRFYTDVADAIEQFENVYSVPSADRIDSLIRCLGARISLDSSIQHIFQKFQ